MISFRLYHAGGLALVLGSALQAATYEVAQQNSQASDEGPGTVERPWKTITKAAESSPIMRCTARKGGMKLAGDPDGDIRWEGESLRASLQQPDGLLPPSSNGAWRNLRLHQDIAANTDS